MYASKIAKKNLNKYEFIMRIERAASAETVSPKFPVRYKNESIATLLTNWLTSVEPLFLSHEYFPFVSFL